MVEVAGILLNDALYCAYQVYVDASVGLIRRLRRHPAMRIKVASRFPEPGKKVQSVPEMCHNSGCLYSISGFLMALTAALKAQIAAWYKALQEQIPDF
ncbi:MAG: hypothetical protein RR818_03650, partial [Citrobacter sp.]